MKSATLPNFSYMYYRCFNVNMMLIAAIRWRADGCPLLGVYWVSYVCRLAWMYNMHTSNNVVLSVVRPNYYLRSIPDLLYTDHHRQKSQTDRICFLFQIEDNIQKMYFH